MDEREVGLGREVAQSNGKEEPLTKGECPLPQFGTNYILFRKLLLLTCFNPADKGGGGGIRESKITE